MRRLLGGRPPTERELAERYRVGGTVATLSRSTTFEDAGNAIVLEGLRKLLRNAMAEPNADARVPMVRSVQDQLGRLSSYEDLLEAQRIVTNAADGLRPEVAESYDVVVGWTAGLLSEAVKARHSHVSGENLERLIAGLVAIRDWEVAQKAYVRPR